MLQANAGRACAGNADHTPSTNLTPSLELHLRSHPLPTRGFQHHPTGERSLPAQPPPENSTQRCHQDSHYPRKRWSVPWGAQYSCLLAFKSHLKCKNTSGGHGLAQARPRKSWKRVSSSVLTQECYPLGTGASGWLIPRLLTEAEHHLQEICFQPIEINPKYHRSNKNPHTGAQGCCCLTCCSWESH